MYHSKNTLGSVALIFSEGKEYSSAMYVSAPPPEWLSDEDYAKIVILESGMYCLHFFLFADEDEYAFLTINNRKIAGSRTACEEGTIFGSAICSVHDAALPCCIDVLTEKNSRCGIFLVTRCKI